MNITKTIFALTTLAAVASASAAQPATYSCERLRGGAGIAFDINDRGVVAGYVDVPEDGRHPAIWRRRSAEVLPYVAGFEGDSTQLKAINRKGDMAGSINDGNIIWPVLWTDGVPATLPRLNNGPYGFGEVWSLNDRGHAVGDSSNAQGFGHATLWKNGKVIDLGALGPSDIARNTVSVATAINASGMVVGISANFEDGLYHAVQWTDGTRGSLVDLGASAFGVYSEAWSVNRYGVVVGNSSVGLDTSHIRPIGWIGVAAFDLKPAANEMDSRARDINDAGTVVGHINSDTPRLLALVWPHYQDAPIDLNTRLDARGCHDADDNRARLTHGVAINNRGEILAKGLFGFSQFEWFRLVPVSNH